MVEQEKIRVVIVDDHTVVRRGLYFVLQSCADIEPVGEADGVERAVQVCGETKPDVVLMDLKMAGVRDGILATEKIRARYPDVQVLVLSSYHDQDLVAQAIQAGAQGYLLKDVSTDELARSIRMAAAGKMTLAPEVAQALMRITLGDDPSEDDELEEMLTDRQMEVLGYMGQGLTNSQIAQELNVTHHTIRHHVSEILGKLGAVNRAEAVAIAMKKGLNR